jgi:hypothetical protein
MQRFDKDFHELREIALQFAAGRSGHAVSSKM